MASEHCAVGTQRPLLDDSVAQWRALRTRGQAGLSVRMSGQQGETSTDAFARQVILGLSRRTGAVFEGSLFWLPPRWKRLV